MVVRDVVNRLPHTSRKWGREVIRFVQRLVQDNMFLALWQVQARAATPTLFALIPALGVWRTALIMSFWSVGAAVVYEQALRRGVQEFLEVDRRAISGAVNHGIRLGIFGWKAWALRVYHDRYSNRFRLPMHMLALVGVGVVATHYHFRRAGFSQREIFWLNLLGRVTSVCFTVTIWAAIWYFVGPYISWFWYQVLWPIRELWHFVGPYFWLRARDLAWPARVTGTEDIMKSPIFVVSAIVALILAALVYKFAANWFFANGYSYDETHGRVTPKRD